MNINEAAQFIENLRNLCDYVRVIDLETFKLVCFSEEKDKIYISDESCFSALGKNERCKNCAAFNSYRKKNTDRKMEIVGKKSFHQICKIISIEEKEYALEMIYEISCDMNKDFDFKKNTVIAALSKNYDLVAHINYKLNEISLFRVKEVFEDLINECKVSKDSENAKNFLDAFFRKIVVQEDFVSFLSLISCKKVSAEVDENDFYEVPFRIMLNGKLCYYLLKFVRDEHDTDSYILGLKCVDEEKEAEKTRLEQEQLQRSLEKQMEVTIIERTSELHEKNKALKRINEDIIELLGDITEARDVESGEHIKRVKGFTNILANQVMEDFPEYNLSSEKIDLITSASALHDIGKIMIPDSILLKPGKLSKEEFEIMKDHCLRGTEVLKKAPQDWDEEYLKISMEICLNHHEKYDGKGYPRGIKGDEIPISAQIVSVADCYDALTSKRVYKDAFSPETAYEMIKNGECGCFSEKILKAFENCKDKFFRQHLNVQKGINLDNYTCAENNLQDISILLVEDNKTMQEIGKEILEDEGAFVTTADNGKEAVDIFRRNPEGFDAILMDIYMPVLTGPEACQQIRSLPVPEAETIPIIALSVSEESDDVKRCFDVGMNSYMVKPLNVSSVSKTLLEALKNKSVKIQEKLFASIKQSSKDPLTGVRDISAYTEMISALTEEIKVNKNLEFAIVECDINELKTVNMVFGNALGDIFIKNSCQLICNVFKRSPVFRIGGDEFIVFLRGSDYQNRDNLLMELKNSEHESEKIPDIALGKASFSAGISVFDKNTDVSLSSVLKRAEESMFNNKRLMKFNIKAGYSK